MKLWLRYCGSRIVKHLGVYMAFNIAAAAARSLVDQAYMALVVSQAGAGNC